MCRIWAARLQRGCSTYRRRRTKPCRGATLGLCKEGAFTSYLETLPHRPAWGWPLTPHNLRLLLSVPALLARFRFSVCLLCLLITQNHNVGVAAQCLCGVPSRHGLSLRVSPSYQLLPMARCHTWLLVSRVQDHVGSCCTQKGSEGRRAPNPRPCLSCCTGGLLGQLNPQTFMSERSHLSEAPKL